MKVNLITNRVKNIFSKPSDLAPMIFLGVGSAKTCLDYFEAPEKDKKKVLLKDTAILLGSVTSLALITPLTRWVSNTKFVDMLAMSFNAVAKFFKKKNMLRGNIVVNKAQNIMSKTEFVIKESLCATVNTFFGVMGAVHANELMNKFVFSRPYFKESDIQKSEIAKKAENESVNPSIPVKDNVSSSSVYKNFDYVNNVFNTKTASRVFSTISDLPGMKVFEKPFVVLSGFSVVETQGYQNKFKKTTYDLLANTLVPTFFVSLADLFVANKKAIVKYPTLLGSLVIGALVGGVVADKSKEKIDKGIDAIGSKLTFM